MFRFPTRRTFLRAAAVGGTLVPAGVLAQRAFVGGLPAEFDPAICRASLSCGPASQSRSSRFGVGAACAACLASPWRAYSPSFRTVVSQGRSSVEKSALAPGPNVFSAIISSMIACTDTFGAGSAMRSLSVKSRIDLILGLRVLRKAGWRFLA